MTNCQSRPIGGLSNNRGKNICGSPTVAAYPWTSALRCLTPSKNGSSNVIRSWDQRGPHIVGNVAVNTCWLIANIITVTGGTTCEGLPHCHNRNTSCNDAIARRPCVSHRLQSRPSPHGGGSPLGALADSQRKQPLCPVLKKEPPRGHMLAAAQQQCGQIRTNNTTKQP